MNLVTIYGHLAKGELPLSDNTWQKFQVESKTDACIKHLKVLIFDTLRTPCTTQKEWMDRLHEIDRIEVLINKKYGEQATGFDFKAIKISIINEIMSRSLEGFQNSYIAQLCEGIDVLDALKHRQFFLLKNMVQSGYLKKVSPAFLKEVVKNASPSWSIWFFNKMIENGLNLKDTDLVQTALINKNYPLAAFLINAGARCNHTWEEADGIRHYAACLKQGTPAEQKLRALINPTNVAHLVGDALIKEMRGDTGKELEGNLSSESLAFMAAAIEYEAEKNPEIDSDALQELSDKLKQAADWALCCESIQCLQSDDQIAFAVESFESDLIKAVNQLKEGEYILFPAGWIDKSSGHAILLEFRAVGDSFEIYVVNTGEGADYHGGIYTTGRLHINTERIYRISKEQLIESRLFRRILEPRVASSQKRSYIPEDFYGALDPFFVEESAIPELQLSLKVQLAGICSLRCILASCKRKTKPEVYESLKFILNKDVMIFAIEQNAQLLNQQPAYAKLLHLSMPHRFHAITKQIKGQEGDLEMQELQLTDLKNYSAKLKESFAPPLSQHETVPLDTEFRTQ